MLKGRYNIFSICIFSIETTVAILVVSGKVDEVILLWIAIPNGVGGKFDTYVTSFIGIFVPDLFFGIEKFHGKVY